MRYIIALLDIIIITLMSATCVNLTQLPQKLNDVRVNKHTLYYRNNNTLYKYYIEYTDSTIYIYKPYETDR